MAALDNQQTLNKNMIPNDKGITIEGVKALFVKPSSLPAMDPLPGKKYANIGFEICDAMNQVREVRSGDVSGTTKINGVWRLCLKGANARIARASILAHGLTIKGHMIPVLNENPNLVDGQETSRLTITNLPFSVSNEALKTALIGIGVTFGKKDLRWDMYRDNQGGMTDYKNGKRWVYIVPPSKPLPKKIKVAGMFNAFLDYQGPMDKDLKKLRDERHIRRGNDIDSDSDTDDDVQGEENTPIRTIPGLNYPDKTLPDQNQA